MPRQQTYMWLSGRCLSHSSVWGNIKREFHTKKTVRKIVETKSCHSMRPTETSEAPLNLGMQFTLNKHFGGMVDISVCSVYLNVWYNGHYREKGWLQCSFNVYRMWVLKTWKMSFKRKSQGIGKFNVPLFYNCRNSVHFSQITQRMQIQMNGINKKHGGTTGN